MSVELPDLLSGWHHVSEADRTTILAAPADRPIHRPLPVARDAPAAPDPDRPACVVEGRQGRARCPKCGSTDAGAIDHMIEITHMMCRGCGHDAYVDSYQLGDDWNVDVELPAGAALLPSHVPPLGKG